MQIDPLSSIRLKRGPSCDDSRLLDASNTQFNFQQLNSTLSDLTKCMFDLKQQVTRLSNPSSPPNQPSPSLDQDKRFIPLKQSVPKKAFSSSGKTLLPMEIKTWLGELVHKVVSTGFVLFEGGKLNTRQTKAFCSERILFNIIELVREQKMNAEHLQAINEFIKSEVLNYVILKYPKSEDKEINQNFSRVVKQVDNLASNENDLVSRSGVNFQYASDGKYNSQIMEFLNYVISLPDERVKINDQRVSLEEAFHIEVGNFFRRIEEEHRLKKMKFTEKEKKNQKNPSEIDELFNQPKDEKSKEYAEKVKLYSKYETDRKLNKNTQIFSRKEIEKGAINFKTSAVMRIVVKWCEELENTFKNISERKEPFIHNSTERFLYFEDLQRLNYELKKEWQKISEKMKLIMSNNYEQQLSFCKNNLFEEFAYCSEFEAKTGVFNAHLHKNSKVYLTAYLNALIHGLLTAEKSCGFNIKLISFNVGDLLRSRCYSKETQIISLYQELLKINHHRPELFKVVSVRDRLAYVTKDILVNILYRNKIVIEMQLGIKSDRSRFIECSDKMNHFIYELQRGSFGPLIELSNVWMELDPRADYYKKKLEESESLPASAPSSSDFETKEEEFPLPFKCRNCNKYIRNFGNLEFQRYDKRFKHKICAWCVGMTARTSDDLMRLFPEFFENQYIENLEIFRGRSWIPQTGFIANNKMVLQKYQEFRKDDEKMIFTKKDNGKLELIATIKKANGRWDYRKLISQNIVLSWHEEDELFSKEEVNRKYIVPKYFEEALNKGFESLMMTRKDLTDESFEMPEGTSFTQVKKISMMENGIKSMSCISRYFPNIEFLVLNFNKISSIRKEDCENMKNIAVLYLRDNGIEYIDEAIAAWNHLRILDLSQNSLESLPEGLYNCKELVSINLSNSQRLTKFSNQLGNLTHLKTLNCSMCLELQELPLSIGNLKHLEILLLYKCEKLFSMPEELADCESLQNLNCYMCSSLKVLPTQLHRCSKLHSLVLTGCQNLQSLNLSFSQMEGLKFLSVGNHRKVDVLPKNIKGCKKLQKLFISDWQIFTLPPHALLKFEQIKLIRFHNCQNLEFIPSGIEELNQLEEIYLLGNEKLASLPEGIGKCQKLEKLTIINCPALKSLPEAIYCCKQLKKLDLRSCTGLKQLPENANKHSSLEVLKISDSKISRIPESIGKCHSLKTLSLTSCDNIEELPDSLSNCLQLSHIELAFCINLRKLPKSIGNCKELEILKIESDEDLQPLPEIDQCSRLSELRLGISNAEELLKEKGKCLELQKLHLNSCFGLTVIPDTLGSCQNLKELAIISCQNLEEITECIGKCEQLKKLSLNRCVSIKTLPISIGICTRLRQLQVQSCPNFKHLPETIFNLKKLPFNQIKGIKSLEHLPDTLDKPFYGSVGLDLSGMINLKQLPRKIGQLITLEELNLEGCQNLEQLPEEIENLQQLRVLNLLDCFKIKSLPQSVANLSKLTLLKISGCETHKSASNMLGNCEEIRNLQISKCRFPYPVLSMASRIKNLKSLKLTECSNFKVVPEMIDGIVRLEALKEPDYDCVVCTFSLCPSLISLTLENCEELQLLTETLTSLKKLEKLTISKCPGFRELPAVIISECEELEILEIHCEDLELLPQNIGSCKRLRILNLAGCKQLKELPQSLSDCGALRQLDLSSVPVNLSEELKSKVNFVVYQKK